MFSRFSLTSLFLMTAVISIMLTVASSRGNGLGDYALGALTGVVAIGLVQQIYNSEASAGKTTMQRASRRCCLIVVLVCLVLAFLQAMSTDHMFDLDRFGAFLRIDLRSEAAESVWLLALLLGATTAPWMSLPIKPASVQRYSFSAAAISTLVVSFVCLYLIMIIALTTSLTAQVDIAIQGVEVALSQPTAWKGPEFVEWFGRTPAEFRQFLVRQCRAWPPLFLSTVLLVFACQFKLDRFKTCLVVFAAVSLAVPAGFNLCWLANGAAARLFPLMTTPSWGGHQQNWLLIPIGTVLLTLYLGTRRSGSPIGIQTNHVGCGIATDSASVGILFVILGMCGIADEVYANVTEFSGTSITSVSELITHLAASPDRIGMLITIFTNTDEFPQRSCIVLSLPYGAYWLWRRSKFQTDGNGQRWPQPESHQLLLLPLLFCSLLVLIVSSLPFGVALMHAAL